MTSEAGLVCRIVINSKIDYIFQLFFFSKALKFYMHDVTVQPDRADTWAAMALARKSRLENKLNAVNYRLLRKYV